MFKELLRTIEESDNFEEVLEVIARIENDQSIADLEAAFQKAEEKNERFKMIRKISACTVGAVM